jgi:hypothetical protein
MLNIYELAQKTEQKDFADCCGNEVLQVRAYGQAYIGLGINIRLLNFQYFINRLVLVFFI